MFAIRVEQIDDVGAAQRTRSVGLHTHTQTDTHRQTDIITCSTSFNIIALLYYILQHIQIIKLSEENSAAGYIVKRDVLSESSV